MPNRQNPSGFTLIEAAMALVIIGLAMAPIVVSIGGQTGDKGNVTRVMANQSKATTFANTILETALAGDFSGKYGLRCGLPMIDDKFWPDLTNPTITYPCNDIGPYQQPMSYQWQLKLVEGNGTADQREVVQGNRLYHATLNVYENTTATGTPLLTLPTMLMQDTGSFSSNNKSTGMVLALDTSGSMSHAKNNNVGNGGGIASPYMKYRYKPYAPVTATVPAELQLDMWDNKNLDIVYAQSTQASPENDPDTNTEFNEAFPYSESAAKTIGKPLMPALSCNNLANWAGTDLQYVFHDAVLPASSVTSKANINALCRAKASKLEWENALNASMSRLEAARTGALSLLLEMERNPEITSNMNMGFISWSGRGIIVEVPMESSFFMTGIGERFRKMRQRLLWINRFDTGNNGNTIGYGDSTPIDLALRESVKQVRTTTGRKIIVLLTDGAPCCSGGTNTPAEIVSYAKSVGNNEPDPDKQVTIFTIGLIGADAALMNDIAAATPNGKSFVTNNISELKSIFEQIAYQAKRLSLLNTGRNYGIDFE